MQEWLVAATEFAVLLMNSMALIVIFYGTIQAFVLAIVSAFRPRDDAEKARIWLRYGRWLVAGLTFQLAADIVETSVAPSWEDIGRLAAIALIRTFLNFFLERDLSEIREGGNTERQERKAAYEGQTADGRSTRPNRGEET